MGSPVGTIQQIGYGTCPCHLGPRFYATVIASGAINVNTNSLSNAIIGSVGISSCGHSTVALTGSSTVNANSLGLHRIGDIGTNCGSYYLATGSINVNAGG